MTSGFMLKTAQEEHNRSVVFAVLRFKQKDPWVSATLHFTGYSVSSAASL